MDKLQYDSFYKFIVSLGVVLIATPILGIYYILNGSYDTILSQTEFDNLSSFSKELLANKANIFGLIGNILPWILLTIITTGIFCIVWGGSKWYKIQKRLDEEVQLNVDEKRYNYEKLTAVEIAQKAIQENTENQNSLDISNLSSQSQHIVKGLQIEQMCFKYLENELSPEYGVQTNIRVGRKEVDLLAISKVDKLDRIYEIKYWSNRNLNISMIFNVFERMEATGEDYSRESLRYFECYLVIVTTSENVDYVKNEISNHFSDFHERFSNPNIIVIPENELNLK